MANRYRGVSHAKDDDAGFRAATHSAVEKYKTQAGAPKAGEPIRLRVAEMYVVVHNPIHEYIVELETADRKEDGGG